MKFVALVFKNACPAPPAGYHGVMPHAKCPICGKLDYLKVDDEAEWFRKYYPTLTVGDVLPGYCYECFQVAMQSDSFRSDEPPEPLKISE